jgi:hypothetical protein
MLRYALGLSSQLRDQLRRLPAFWHHTEMHREVQQPGHLGEYASGARQRIRRIGLAPGDDLRLQVSE